MEIGREVGLMVGEWRKVGDKKEKEGKKGKVKKGKKGRGEGENRGGEG
jgi:hypothetical protein